MPGGNPGIPEAESGNFIWSRRDLLSLAGWGAILTCFGIAGGAIVRLLFPRVLFEPPTSFKAGYPTEYTVGDVSEKWMKSQRVWIVRTSNSLYALLGICTHLGCTPRPLERVKIPLADDGQLVVDKAFRYRYELGQWDDPNAFVKFSGA